MSAFAVLMASAKRKADELDADTVIGIGYEAKLCGEGVDPDDPLYGTCYYGIAVRRGYASPEALQMERQREHEAAAKSDPKELGVRAILARYGSRALVWRVVESKTDKGSVETQEWANAWEQHAIAAAGGVLRDMEPEERIRQTFNLTKGGAWGDAQALWTGIEAKCNLHWKHFQRALEGYIVEYKSARVPTYYVDSGGYRLGQTVHSVRQGAMIVGRPDETTRRAYLEALPEWSWNVNDAAWQKFKAALKRYVDLHGTSCVPVRYKDENGYRLGETVANVRSQGYYLKGKDDEAERRTWLQALAGWTWDGNDAGWQLFKKALHAHVRKTGTSYIPQTYTDEDGFPLGRTLHNVRSGLYLAGKTDEYARRAWLEALPGWVWVSTAALGASNTAAELGILRATTHLNAKKKDIKQLRDAHCVIRAHEVLRDRAVSSAIDDLLDRVMARVVTRMEVK